MRTKPMTMEDLEDLDERGVVKDGKKVTVPVMDNMQRAVAGVSTSDAEAARTDFRNAREAARNARRQELIAIGVGKRADSCRSRPRLRDDVAHRNGMMSPTITR